MDTITSKDFIQMIKRNKNTLVFGNSGIGKASIITMYTEQKNIPILFFDEQNQAEPDALNTLYNMTRQKHTHARKRIPYKYGKHSK